MAVIAGTTAGATATKTPVVAGTTAPSAAKVTSTAPVAGSIAPSTPISKDTIKIGGEYYSKAAIETLPEGAARDAFLKGYTSSTGTVYPPGPEAYQHWVQDQQGTFEATHVKLPSGEWISQEDYTGLSQEMRQKLSELGIEGFKTYLAGEQAAFEAANTQLSTGEWISNEMLTSLSTEQQTELQTLGIEGFNAAENTKYQAAVAQAQTEYEAAVAAQAQAQTDWEAAHVKLPSGEWIDPTQNMMGGDAQWISLGSYYTMPAWEQRMFVTEGLTAIKGLEGKTPYEVYTAQRKYDPALKGTEGHTLQSGEFVIYTADQVAEMNTAAQAAYDKYIKENKDSGVQFGLKIFQDAQRDPAYYAYLEYMRVKGYDLAKKDMATWGPRLFVVAYGQMQRGETPDPDVAQYFGNIGRMERPQGFWTNVQTHGFFPALAEYAHEGAVQTASNWQTISPIPGLWTVSIPESVRQASIGAWTGFTDLTLALPATIETVARPAVPVIGEAYNPKEAAVALGTGAFLAGAGMVTFVKERPGAIVANPFREVPYTAVMFAPMIAEGGAGAVKGVKTVRGAAGFEGFGKVARTAPARGLTGVPREIAVIPVEAGAAGIGAGVALGAAAVRPVIGGARLAGHGLVAVTKVPELGLGITRPIGRSILDRPFGTREVPVGEVSSEFWLSDLSHDLGVPTEPVPITLRGTISSATSRMTANLPEPARAFTGWFSRKAASVTGASWTTGPVKGAEVQFLEPTAYPEFMPEDVAYLARMREPGPQIVLNKQGELLGHYEGDRFIRAEYRPQPTGLTAAERANLQRLLTLSEIERRGRVWESLGREDLKVPAKTVGTVKTTIETKPTVGTRPEEPTIPEWRPRTRAVREAQRARLQQAMREAGFAEEAPIELRRMEPARPGEPELQRAVETKARPRQVQVAERLNIEELQRMYERAKLEELLQHKVPVKTPQRISSVVEQELRRLEELRRREALRQQEALRQRQTQQQRQLERQLELQKQRQIQIAVTPATSTRTQLQAATRVQTATKTQAQTATAVQAATLLQPQLATQLQPATQTQTQVAAQTQTATQVATAIAVPTTITPPVGKPRSPKEEKQGKKSTISIPGLGQLAEREEEGLQTVRLLAKTNPDQGRVTPGFQRYEYDSAAVVAARPIAGYRFSHWVGDVPVEKRMENPLHLTMNSDKTVTAVFQRTARAAPSALPSIQVIIPTTASALRPVVDPFRPRPILQEYRRRITMGEENSGQFRYVR